MACNYNTRGRAAEVLVSGDRATLIRRRETLDDQLRSERMLRRLSGRGRGRAARRPCDSAKFQTRQPSSTRDDRRRRRPLPRSRSCRRASRRSAAAPSSAIGVDRRCSACQRFAPSALIARLNEVAASGIISTKRS